MATIDVQVGVSADDGYTQVESSAFDNTNLTSYTGKYDSATTYNSFYRFTGITIAIGSTVNGAYLSFYESATAASVGTPLTKIYADDQNGNVAAPTTAADYNGRTVTTAAVDEDGNPTDVQWNNTASIVSIIQELVTSYDYSNGAILILHKDDGSAANNYRRSRTWDSTASPTHTWGAKLHIEYTPAGGGVPSFTGGLPIISSDGIQSKIFGGQIVRS